MGGGGLSLVIVSTAPNLQDIAAQVKRYRQDSARPYVQNNAVIVLEYDARSHLAANVARLMQAHPDKESPAKLAKQTYWPAGRKKGKRVSERQIRYLLDTRDDAPSPGLDVIVAIANAFEVPAWQLLADDKMIRLWEIGRLFSMPEAVSDATVEKHLPLPPTEKRRRQA